MALTPSTMLPLGTKAPHFSLSNGVDSTSYSLESFSDAKAILVMFICNHCPYVIHIREDFGPLAEEFSSEGLQVIAINSNDIANYPQDAPEKMKALADSLGWNFPFLMDNDQSVAKAYQAACTPDFYLFNGEQELVYRGQWDSSSPGNNNPVNGEDMRQAIRSTLSSSPAQEDQIPAMGCNIKWKAGNAPPYFG